MRWCDTNCEQCHAHARDSSTLLFMTAGQQSKQNTKPELHIKWWPSTAVYHIKVNQKCLSNQTLQANIFTFNCTLPTICKIINMYRNTDNFIIQVTEFAPKQNKVWCISSNWYQKHNVGSVSPQFKNQQVYLTMLTLMFSSISLFALSTVLPSDQNRTWITHCTAWNRFACM